MVDGFRAIYQQLGHEYKTVDNTSTPSLEKVSNKQVKFAVATLFPRVTVQ